MIDLPSHSGLYKLISLDVLTCESHTGRSVASNAGSPGGRCGEVWGGVGRCREVWGGAGRCGKVWGV